MCIWCVHCAVLSCLCSLRAVCNMYSLCSVQFVQCAVCAVCSLCSLCSVCATLAQLSCFLPQGVLFSNRGKWTQVQMLFHSFVCLMRSHFHIFSSRTIIKHLWALWWIRCKQLGCRGGNLMQGEIQIQKQIQLQIHIRCKQLEYRAGSLMQEETALAQGRSGGRVYAQELRFPFIDSFCSL